ncbi:DUF167 domain-containing protein [Amphiplicatus metriothermophilus]|uniref:UPF0235 protein SAMN06297382_1873 n=1 Tax=Amphiplicatus metriothermophilus TaxID=1519374 RepID=A0A239PU36_9PROT|nr:DUF167 domain-containing protein [Amphiplicatus metriothermophilus]MBB5519404.1 hypothetical protein [Amphiplicatus metriothermophilus]SNT73553.1 hypothetical protein SAMN06297382_1873 [Amphiplicatus metriothermophilus]
MSREAGSRFYQAVEGGFLLQARVIPGAAKNETAGLRRGPDGTARLVVRVASPPDKGRANRAVVETLARALGLPKSAVSIRAGEKDRLKTIAIADDSAAVAEQLASLAGVASTDEKE